MAELKVTKHNDLVETSYKLGAREQFFLLFLIANLSTRDNDLPQYRLPFSKIMKLMNFDGRRRIANVKDLEKMMDNLNTAPIKFVDGDEDVKVAWITELRYNRKTKELAFTLNPNLKHYLLNLKGFFTNYNLWNVVNLNTHSIRLYELLKRHEFRREQAVIFKVDYLKQLLGIEDKYPEFYEFKRWVLQTAQEELETYTDIRFLYTEHEKEGKRVLSLKFDIYANEPKERPEGLNFLDMFRLSDTDKSYLLTPSTKDAPLTAKHAEQEPKEAPKTAVLFWAQHRAYTFLLEQGINRTFVLDKILKHPKLGYSELRGFEDIYFNVVWQFFKNKSTAKQLAGAFVSWWKNERFTNEQHHARFLEAVVVLKKKMPVAELDARKTAASMTFEDFERLSKTKQAPSAPEKPSAPPVRKAKEQSFQQALTAFSAAIQQEAKPVFNLENFKQQEPEMYQIMWQKAQDEYAAFYKAAGIAFSVDALHLNIEAKARGYCEEWVMGRMKVG